MPIRTLAVLPLALAVVGLAACGAEATVSSEDVAAAAEDALEEQIGSRPEIDCGGDDAIAVVEGEAVDCVLTDPSTGSEFDTTVTFTGVDGGEWNADVEVASEPNGDAAADPAETGAEESPSAAADDAGLEVEAARLAEAAEDALEEQIGSRPEIDCGELNLTVHVDRRTYCTLTDDATGSEYEVTITVTSIQGDQFEFDVQVADTPRD